MSVPTDKNISIRTHGFPFDLSYFICSIYMSFFYSLVLVNVLSFLCSQYSIVFAYFQINILIIFLPSLSSYISGLGFGKRTQSTQMVQLFGRIIYILGFVFFFKKEYLLDGFLMVESCAALINVSVTVFGPVYFNRRLVFTISLLLLFFLCMYRSRKVFCSKAFLIHIFLSTFASFFMVFIYSWLFYCMTFYIDYFSCEVEVFPKLLFSSLTEYSLVCFSCVFTYCTIQAAVVFK